MIYYITIYFYSIIINENKSKLTIFMINLTVAIIQRIKILTSEFHKYKMLS